MGSMRDELNAALDAVANKDDTQDFDETPQEIIADEPTDESTTESGESVEDGDSEERETGKTAVEKAVKTAEAAKQSGDDKAETNAESTESVGQNDSIKAPIDWGPKDRESWSKIPRHLQEKVMSREKELNTLMQSTVEARKTHEAFNQLSTKYGAALSGVAGSNPIEVAGNLFNTVANLRMGSPIQKAQIIADMISDFGVDINTLDSAIVGQPAPAYTQEQDRVERLLAERLAPFEQMLGQQNAYAQQQKTQVQEAANREVQEFSQQAEFLNDVRHDMADLVDMAAKRGYNMPLKEAYDKACAFNPEVSAIMNERQKRASLTANNNSIASKRNAASSVNGRQIGGGGANPNASIRDSIASAWDSQGKI